MNRLNRGRHKKRMKNTTRVPYNHSKIFTPKNPRDILVRFTGLSGRNINTSLPCQSPREHVLKLPRAQNFENPLIL